MKKWFIINLHKLSDELGLIEKSEELPCDMQSVWDLLEKTSGKDVLDPRTSNIRERLRVNIDIIQEKGYYCCGLNKSQREHLIELSELPPPKSY